MQKRMEFLVTVFIATLIGLSCIRVTFLWTYGFGSASAEPLISDLCAGLARGIRFDAKWTAIVFFPSLVALLIACVVSEPLRNSLYRVSDGLAVFLAALLFLLSLINFGFFGFYGSPINSLIFGSVQDDTWAVIVSVVKDWPVVRYCLVLVCFVAVLCLARKKLIDRSEPDQKKAKLNRIKEVAFVVLGIVVCASLARGSFGTFPLRQTDLNATTDAFINQAVNNGAQAFYDAIKEQRQQNIGNNPLSGLRALGFKTEDEARSFLTPHKLTCTSEMRLPNIVLVVMEAMGKDLFESHVPGVNDTLGAMAQAVQTGDLFLNSLSIQNGTFPSLEGLLFNTPISPISQSRYGHRSFGFSSMREFQRAGYKTVFLTSGTSVWRNVDINFPRQGFDAIYGFECLKERYGKNIEAGTWGIPDEYMFRYAQELLKESEREGKPLFLVCLSTTNHPPYKTPTGYQVKPLSYEALPVWKTRDSKIARSIMETYQYASDSLGHFILDIPKETRGQTIIVATGDHNTRTIFEYPASSLLNHQFGVPLFFSVPKAWRPTNPDTRKWVGHFDVFPTLRELVLKEPARAFEGRNVYGTEDGFSLSFSYAVGGNGIAINEAGAVANLAHPQYFVRNGAHGRFVPTEKPTEGLLKLRREAAARMGLADARVRKDCLLKK